MVSSVRMVFLRSMMQIGFPSLSCLVVPTFLLLVADVLPAIETIPGDCDWLSLIISFC